MVYLKESHTLIASFTRTKSSPKGGEIWISTDDGKIWNKMSRFFVDFDDNELDDNNYNLVISATSTTGEGIEGGVLYAFAGGVMSSNTGQQLQVCSPICVDCEFHTVSSILSSVSEQYGNNLMVAVDPRTPSRVFIGGSYTSENQEHMLRCDGVNVKTGELASNSCFRLVRDGTADNSEPHGMSFYNNVGMIDFFDTVSCCHQLTRE